MHTAAASNLGQMLQKICTADGVPLVNIVRRKEHEELLRGIGATHVVNSSSESFMADLIAALADTGATLGFDATGGGKLAGQILTAMEAALSANAPEYNRYGSATLKQVYIYGGLDRSQTVLTRNFGMAWGLGGWLLPHFLQRIGYEASETAPAAGRRRDQDDVRVRLRKDRYPAGGARSGVDRGLREAGDR